MTIGVDTSKWKPRKIKGTPAAVFRNYLGIAIIGVGVGCGLLFHFASITKNLRNATEKLYEDPIEEVERRMIIGSGLPTRTGKTIRKEMAEESRIDQPHI